MLSGPQHCEIESTLSAKDNLSIFTQRLIYQYIPDNVRLVAQTNCLVGGRSALFIQNRNCAVNQLKSLS
jgi:hypothetical protein